MILVAAYYNDITLSQKTRTMVVSIIAKKISITHDICLNIHINS
jgi:hypothetical protein